MTNPCIENKCILYPICKFKQEITCKELEDYLDLTDGEAWEEIRIVIPNLIVVKSKQYDKFIFGG